MSEHPGHVVRIERTFDAPIQEVFDAWTSEEVLRRWWHADPDWETPSAEVDVRVGPRRRAEADRIGHHPLAQPRDAPATPSWSRSTWRQPGSFACRMVSP